MWWEKNHGTTKKSYSWWFFATIIPFGGGFVDDFGDHQALQEQKWRTSPVYVEHVESNRNHRSTGQTYSHRWSESLEYHPCKLVWLAQTSCFRIGLTWSHQPPNTINPFILCFSLDRYSCLLPSACQNLFLLAANLSSGTKSQQSPNNEWIGHCDDLIPAQNEENSTGNIIYLEPPNTLRKWYKSM